MKFCLEKLEKSYEILGWKICDNSVKRWWTRENMKRGTRSSLEPI